MNPPSVRSTRKSMRSGMCLFGFSLWSQHQSIWHIVSTCWIRKTAQWWNHEILLTTPVCWHTTIINYSPVDGKSLSRTLLQGSSLIWSKCVLYPFFLLEFHSFITLKINFSAYLRVTAWNFAQWSPLHSSLYKASAFPHCLDAAQTGCQHPWWPVPPVCSTAAVQSSPVEGSFQAATGPYCWFVQ